jgi:2-polyprenyl-6-hydroxyphenyl methylase/3-demethylubiquinone-9 3-methyltransferase
MEKAEHISGYRYSDSLLNESHTYLLPKVEQILARQKVCKRSIRVFDLGCGNGSVAAFLADLGYSLLGVDPSAEGIAAAQKAYPQLSLHLGSAYDDLVQKYGRFDVVLSLEVVEHVYSPRKYAATIYDLLEDGGIAVISTPYHGYWKNLALAVTGKFDDHFTALWDHGHIKFWSIRTLSALLEEVGFKSVKFYRVGRLPFLAKSMIAVATR